MYTAAEETSCYSFIPFSKNTLLLSFVFVNNSKFLTLLFYCACKTVLHCFVTEAVMHMLLSMLLSAICRKSRTEGDRACWFYLLIEISRAIINILRSSW